MLFLFVVEILDFRDVFPFFFDNVGVSTHCRRIMATTLFLPLMVLRTSLMVLIFFISLALVGRRLLGVLVTRYVSGRSVNRLISFRVFFFFFCRLIPWRYFESILRVFEGGCSNTFAFILTTFLMVFFQKSSSQFQVFNYT